ncbi:hypothetical protein ACFFJY_08930 [Fictibacillus aquaticus]
MRLSGMELEKEKPNTSEDFFNRSEAVYDDGGKEKTFQLLYVRYFEDLLAAKLGWDKDAVLVASERKYAVKDIAALAALTADEGNKNKRKAYINDFDEFAKLFSDVNVNKIKSFIG